MTRQTEKAMLRQGALLAAAAIFTKLIGFLYRIPMANLLGSQGNGIYSVSFGIYNIALTLSSCSLPLAVSKLVSARVALNRERCARRVFWDTLIFAVAMGGIAALLLWLGADWLEMAYNCPGLALPLRVLSPTTFVVALLGTFRGWFQGHGNMTPTAVSQILEQVINAVVSVLAAWQLMRLHTDSEDLAAWGAAGGTVGTLAGAAVGLLLVAMHFFQRKPRRKILEEPVETHAFLYKALLLTVIPVILSQTIYQVGNTLDDLIFGAVMTARGMSDATVSALRGVFHTQYNQMVNLPVAVATAMAASTVPGIVSASVTGDRRDAHRKITSVIKLNMAVAIPSAVGLAVLAAPLMELLFPRLAEDQALAAQLLQFGSSAAVFYALSTITTSILQASDRMRLPVKHCAISLALHVALVYALLRFTDLGIYALLIGNITFPLLVSILNCQALTQELRYRWRVGRMFFVPLLSSLGMGIVTWGSCALLRLVKCPAGIYLCVALVLSIAVYGILILKLHCFSDRQLQDLPMGGRLLNLSRRLDGR